MVREGVRVGGRVGVRVGVRGDRDGVHGMGCSPCTIGTAAVMASVAS